MAICFTLSAEVLRRDPVFGPFIEAAEIVGVDPSVPKYQVAAGLVLGSVELYKRVGELALQCMASESSHIPHRAVSWQ